MHELVAEPWAAACMEPAEWADWLARNPQNASGGRVDRPCADCPLGFALEMRALGRCNGTPAGAEDDDEAEPVTMPRATTPDRLAPARAAAEPRTLEPIRIASRPTAAVDVDLELPCAGCVHVDVCSIRETLERTPVRIPAIAAPHRAISLELRVVASCDHFLAPASASRPAAQIPAVANTAGAGAPPRARPEPRTAVPSPGRRPARVERPESVLRNSRSAGDTVSRGREALAAMERHGGDRDAAAAELGYRPNAFAIVVKHARAREAAAT